MSIVTEIQNDITGAAALADWLGGEAPVWNVGAEMRAEICVKGNGGKPCPLNCAPGWWERHVKDPIARWITRELEEKHRMNLATPYDDQLGMCRACGCCIKLKVWTPASVLRHHVTKKHLNHAPGYCWMKKEML